MVSYFGGICELCGEAGTLATREQLKAAGLDVDVSACLDCLKRMNSAAGEAPAPPAPTKKPS
jgi:hypothetical protein